MKLNFIKKESNWRLIAILAIFVFVYIVYNCVPEKKEYFVVKGKSPFGEILLDQNDFAEIVNGMKPKHVTGTFTADDLSELVRELKINFVKHAQKGCATGHKSCTKYSRQLLALIDETNKTVTGKMDKSQWVNAIIIVGNMMNQTTPPQQSQTRPMRIPDDDEPEHDEPDPVMPTKRPVMPTK